MKRKIWLGLLTVLLCLGLIGIPEPSIVDAQPSEPTEINSICPEDTSLKGCWLFNDGTGSIATDGSDYGNNGTIIGATWVADRFDVAGKALHFNGNNQWVQVPDNANNSLDITGDFTISAWVKPEVVKTQAVVKKAVTTPSREDGYELSLSMDDGSCTASPCAFGLFNNYSSGNLYRIEASTTYTVTNDWSLYVVTYTTIGNTLRIFRDGVESTYNSPATPLVLATNNLYLGFGAQLSGSGPTANHLFKGSLDDILIYNRALSDTEISALYDLPTAVNVTGFNINSTPHGIQLGWQSAQEVDLLGFNIYRTDTLGGFKVKINTDLIPSVNPGQLMGNAYQYLDPSTIPGKIYDYWVEWVGTRASDLFGPITGSAWLYTWLPLEVR